MRKNIKKHGLFSKKKKKSNKNQYGIKIFETIT